MSEKADAVVVGAGLAGLVAACELADRGKQVVVLDQEAENSLGGQAFWSLGGLFLVDTPEQRRLKIRDSAELAWQDWLGSARFDREEDKWPRRWAEKYIEFAAGQMRPWLHSLGMRWFPVVGWAERGGGAAHDHGNSVPRFHLTWGTGPGVIEPFVRRAREAEKAGLIRFRFRHRVTAIDTHAGAVSGVSGEILVPTQVARGHESSRQVETSFSYSSKSVIATSGGIGANFDLIRKSWPAARLGKAPKNLISGVPRHVDGAMLAIAEQSGARLINTDRMWHYTEGVKNWDPIWPHHGIRILPGPSSMWFDANGERLEPPCLPGFDTMTTLKRILQTGEDYSWFILSQRIIEKEFALSGSEQNPDLTSKKWTTVLKSRLGKGAPAPVKAFKRNGEDFIVRQEIGALVEGMNRLAGSGRLDPARIAMQIEARDREFDNPFSKDAQVTAIHGARSYLGDKLIRTARPHKILDPANGPLIAVRLSILTRKTLGGIETDLDGRALGKDGEPVSGLFAAGEVAGFGGGGYHGYNALEGTFLGGCIFSGRAAGRNAG